MKTPMVSSATSFQRLQTSLQSPMPRLPRSNVYSTQAPANPSASVHRKRFFTPSLTLKFLCAGYLNRGERGLSAYTQGEYEMRQVTLAATTLATLAFASAAYADSNYGPRQNSNQCWHNQGSNSLGYWAPCQPSKGAQAASTRASASANNATRR